MVVAVVFLNWRKAQSMNRRSHILHTFLIVSALALCAVLPLAAQSEAGSDSANLTGNWSMVSITPSGESIEWKLNIKQENGVFTGTVVNEDGEKSAKDFKVNGKKVHLLTLYQGGEYDIDLEFDGQKLTGKWKGGDDSGTTTGTKSATPAK